MTYQPLTKEDIEDFDNLIFEFLCNDYEDCIGEELRNLNDVLNDVYISRVDILFLKFIELLRSDESYLDDYFRKLKYMIKYVDENENDNEDFIAKFNECFDCKFGLKFKIVNKETLLQLLENFLYVKNCITNNLQVTTENNIYENFYDFVAYEHLHITKLNIIKFINNMTDYEKYVYIKEEIMPKFKE